MKKYRGTHACSHGIKTESFERFSCWHVFAAIPRIFYAEIRVHNYILETKEQSKQCTHKGYPPPKKGKTGVSAGNVMAILFGEFHEIILADYSEKGKTKWLDLCEFATTILRLN